MITICHKESSMHVCVCHNVSCACVCLSQCILCACVRVALRNFAVYARTPLCQNYGHTSNPRIPGLYSIDVCHNVSSMHVCLSQSILYVCLPLKMVNFIQREGRQIGTRLYYCPSPHLQVTPGERRSALPHSAVSVQTTHHKGCLCCQ